MKLKYYMRGLGIGIVFTAAVYTMAGKNNTMSEEEIIAEAKKLGMTETSKEDYDLGEILKQPSVTQEPMAVSTPESSPEPTIEPTKPITTPIPTMQPTTKPTITPAPTLEVNTNEPPEDSESPTATGKPELDSSEIEEAYAYLTIKSGMTSNQVAALAKEKGLVDDEKAFDSYLTSNGYSSRILVNTYKIKLGVGYKEIAETIITKMEWMNPPKQ